MKMMYDYNSIINRLTSGHLEGIYKPVSAGTRLNTYVPDEMEQIHEILNELKTKFTDVDEFVRRRLDYTTKQELYKHFSAEQIDALALIFYNYEFRDQGVIIADQTGIGKGRIAAGLLRYAKLTGKKPVFLTYQDTLFSDIYRDLNDIGQDDLVPLEFAQGKPEYIEVFNEETGETELKELPMKYHKNSNYGTQIKNATRFVPFILNNNTVIKDKNGNIIYKTPSGEKRQEELERVAEFDLSDYDVILATYSQFNNQKLKLCKYCEITKREWFEKIIKDNIVVLDESHLAAGTAKTEEKKEHGLSKVVKENRGAFFKRVVEKAKVCVYLSATYAKYPDNYPLYYPHTSMRYSGLTPLEFTEIVKSKGFVLQELISTQLVQSGNLIRRERPLKGVKFAFNYITENKQEQYKLYDSFVNLLKEIIRFSNERVRPFVKGYGQAKQSELEKAYKEDYIADKASDLGFKVQPLSIFSTLFNIVYQLIFAIKSRYIAEIALKKLEQDKKVVIVFRNTMESIIKEMADKRIKRLDYNYLLERALNKTLIFKEYEYKNKKIVKVRAIKIAIDDKDLKEKPEGVDFVIKADQALKEEYYKILKKIRDTRLNIPVSPIDYIDYHFKKAGYKVGEITGRSQKIDVTTGKIKPRKKEKTTDTVRKFQNNELDVILFNQSGSTGISLHAVPTEKVPKNKVKQRAMIIAQPELDINQFVQMLGRVNRTGQIYPPEYDIVSLVVPAEQRLMTMLQRKLKSLEANVSSNQQRSKTVINVPDFLNKYGGQVITQWLEENEDIAQILDYPHLTSQGFINPDMTTVANRTTGRVAILDTKTQERFYEEITASYLLYEQQLKTSGEWDLEIDYKDLDAKILSETVIGKGGYPETPFGGDSVLLHCDVKNLKKPYTYKQIIEQIEKFHIDIDKTVRDLEKYINEERNNIVQRINERYEKTISEAKKRGLKQEEISEIERERNDEIELKVNKFNRIYKFMLNTLEELQTGEVYSVPLRQEEDEKGNKYTAYSTAIFLGWRFLKKDSEKKFRPSNLIARFAVADPQRYKDINFTPKGIAEFSDVSREYTPASKWDDLVKNMMSPRMEMFMVVGNILGVMSKYKGNLSRVKFNNGNVVPALLLPKDFKYTGESYVSIIKVAPLLEQGIISSITSDSENTKFDGIKITRFSNGNYLLELPSKIAKAKEFFVSELLELLTTKEFVRDRGEHRYNALFKAEVFEQVINILHKKFSVKVRVNNNLLELLAKNESETETQDLTALTEIKKYYEEWTSRF